MANNLAYIDYEKCTLCRKCVEVCPTNAIHEINFKPRKPRPPKAAKKPAPKKAVVVEENVNLGELAKAKADKIAEKPEAKIAEKKPENNEESKNQ